MNDHFYAVIMAGGGGTRLWPLSRKSRPKQMLRLIGERTLFQIAIDRLNGLLPPERIFVVTVADQAFELQKSRPQVPTENYLIEPAPRGTASVVGLAAAALTRHDPQAVMAILTADHFIQDEELFRRMLSAAEEIAGTGPLVTLGITPSSPSTAYGYIQRSDRLGETAGGFPFYRVERFKEKPAEAQAREMVAAGDHDWNSGMFIWRADRILDEFRQHMPDLFAAVNEIRADWGSERQAETVTRLWPGLKNETIDYGIMERAADVVVLPASGLGWNDVGSWESLFDVVAADANGNVILDAQHLALDTQNTLICESDTGRLIVTIGIKDLVIIDTGDALLVCDKNQAQQVREVVNQLKQDGRGQYL